MLKNFFFKKNYFRYIYGGRLSLEACDILDIIKIMEAANELSLHELIDYLQTLFNSKKEKLD